MYEMNPSGSLTEDRCDIRTFHRECSEQTLLEFFHSLSCHPAKMVTLEL
jgi:hypothetical protein